MLRNKNVLLSLVTILALASFGFTSFGSINYVPSATNQVAIQSLPASSTTLITTSSSVCDNDKDGDDTGHCTDDNTPDGDADDIAALVKVSPDLAGFCALHKQPAGTEVASVDGVFEELAFPYYKVTLAGPQGNPVVYINASNCNIIPAP
jgi:hypothetical protein